MGGGEQPRLPISGVRHLLAVGSGKGGVGKTTSPSTWRWAWRQIGHKTGLLDADVYGPNVPLMMGINHTPMAPAIAYSLCSSMASSSCRWAF